MEYPRLHLLGLPIEIRMMIWRHIYNDILTGRGNKWHEPPVTSWGGLLATSSIIHDEVSEFWPRTMVPYHKDATYTRAYSRVTNLAGGLTKSLYKDFRHLSIQLPIRKDQDAVQFYRHVAAGILGLAPVLQDLRIFFIGENDFGSKTNFLGCGLRVYRDKSQSLRGNLLREGSSFIERGVVFHVLKHLPCLRNLVLSNANYPLLQSLVGYKPHLKTLSLLTDSRAPLYKHLGGPLVAWCPPPRLQTLQISANAVLGAVNMILKVVGTLKDLTFIIPSEHWQEEGWKWLEQAAVLVQYISILGKGMRRFRLCIEQPLREETAGALMAAFKQHLPNTNLEILEIHATLDSEYFGRELIEALPKTLKRLYISQELVYPEVVLEAIGDRYFGPKDEGGHEQAGYLGLVGYEYWDRESTRLAFLRMNGALLDRERNAHLFVEFRHSSFRFGGGDSFRFTGDGSLCDGNRVLCDFGAIGEDIMSAEDIPEGALAYYEDQNVKHITEVEMVFHAEEAAKAEDRVPFLVMPDNTEVTENDHWMTE